MGVTSDVKVSPSPQPVLNPGVVQWAGGWRPGNRPCSATGSVAGDPPALACLPVCAGMGGMGF